jgi:ABC-2 type transport system ATP-binding protein
VIEITNLSKNYGDKKAVCDLSLSIKRGEIYGFLGPNGAGKTTTIRMLAGLLKPSAGNVEINQQNYQTDPAVIKKIIGYIPDRPYVYDKLTGWEFLRFIGQLYGLTKEEIQSRGEYWLERFHLIEDASRLTEGFSHGMRQKLVFSSCFMHQPDLIIVDEPMVGLDPRSARLLKDILREQIADGKTVFLSTHTLSVAQELCSRIGIIHHGSLLIEGSFEELQKAVEGQSREAGVDLESVFLQLTEEEEE